MLQMVSAECLFGRAPGGQAGDQVADQNGGSGATYLRTQSHSVVGSPVVTGQFLMAASGQIQIQMVAATRTGARLSRRRRAGCLRSLPKRPHRVQLLDLQIRVSLTARRDATRRTAPDQTVPESQSDCPLTPAA